MSQTNILGPTYTAWTNIKLGAIWCCIIYGWTSVDGPGMIAALVTVTLVYLGLTYKWTEPVEFTHQ